uniref:Uncharacterized protein n=1 Tax=Magallana gigas TaxID=29159 RepID=A0A8W8MP78_MAGGI|nr:uncharacterized protein LOC117686298 [Crassostrea gigas]
MTATTTRVQYFHLGMGKELFKHMRKREYPCVCCKKRTNQRDRRTVTAAQRLVLQKWTVGDVSEDEVLCSLCRVKVHSHLKRRKSEQQNLEHELRDTAPFSPPERKQINARNAAIHSPPSVTLTVPSTSSSHSSCFICRKPGPKLVVVSSNERSIDSARFKMLHTSSPQWKIH